MSNILIPAMLITREVFTKIVDLGKLFPNKYIVPFLATCDCGEEVTEKVFYLDTSFTTQLPIYRERIETT